MKPVNAGERKMRYKIWGTLKYTVNVSGYTRIHIPVMEYYNIFICREALNKKPLKTTESTPIRQKRSLESHQIVIFINVRYSILRTPPTYHTNQLPQGYKIDSRCFQRRQEGHGQDITRNSRALKVAVFAPGKTIPILWRGRRRDGNSRWGHIWIPAT